MFRLTRSLFVTLAIACAFLSFVGCAAPTATGRFEEVDLSRSLEELDATFVVRDIERGTTQVHNPARAATGFVPASTFKIPNAMIGLETGLLEGPETLFAWDQARDPAQPHWPTQWQQDQTLRSAFRNSVVWYFRELARRIGAERMQSWLDRLDYGNRDMSGGIDQFWLNGAFRITAYEQVDFLERFLRGRLPISQHTSAAMRDIMLLEETPQYRLSGKTGTSAPEGAAQLGWLVGFTERAGRTHVFALNMSGDRVWQDYPPQRRAELVRRLLRELGVLPSDG